mgnify:FL=1|jgi:hypothetical protein|tara:strand:- start:95 stop:328 length:234 start_codon:yes stop_codon:yes gene_type:complete
MNKMKDTLMITVMALAFLTLTGMAKADEKTIQAIKAIPTKIASHISNEVQETKEYQAKSWAEAKAQWTKLKNKFISQ